MSAFRTRSLRRSPARGDAELLELVAHNDVEALGEIYDRYARDVWRAVRRTLGATTNVDDLVHAVFIKLPQIARSYDGRPSCQAWLCGIGVRLALRHRRSAGRLRKVMEAFAQMVGGTAHGDPERRVSANQELSAFERALERLSPKKRAVFVLVEFEGLTTDEAAKALEIPPATVRTRLFHARRELHERLQRERAR
jgi:RNA polymerase sigma-70 factor (ECF subfamily)